MNFEKLQPKLVQITTFSGAKTEENERKFNQTWCILSVYVYAFTNSSDFQCPFRWLFSRFPKFHSHRMCVMQQTLQFLKWTCPSVGGICWTYCDPKEIATCKSSHAKIGFCYISDIYLVSVCVSIFLLFLRFTWAVIFLDYFHGLPAVILFYPGCLDFLE